MKNVPKPSPGSHPSLGFSVHLLRACGRTLILATLLVSCSRHEEPSGAVFRPVRFKQVFSTGGARVRTFSGMAQASDEPRLSFKVAGTIQRLEVKVGDRVRLGQLIAELDPLDYQLQVEDAQASLRRAQAEARNAQASFRRIRDLYENGHASRNDYDASRAAAESSQASVNSVEKRLELAQRQLEYTRLVAPVEGAVAEVDVEVNENVRAGEPVIRLTSGSSLEVVANIPDSLIAQVRQGSQVTVIFSALPGSTFPATVTEVGVATTGSSTTFPVTARLVHRNAEVRPGMAAEVEFLFGRKGEPERILLPPHAVGEDREGRFVFLVEPREGDLGVVRRRSVTVGELTADGLEIKQGVADGDRVITAGLSYLKDGEQVRMM